jgi:hypothetical protein
MRVGIGINARRLHALKHLQRCTHIPTLDAALQQGRQRCWWHLSGSLLGYACRVR